MHPQHSAVGDPERFREALLECTSGLRNSLLSDGDVVAATSAYAERFCDEAEQLAIPGLRRCAQALNGWLESPGGLAARRTRGFDEVAVDVVGLLEECVDAALLDAPAEQMDPLFARIQARGECELAVGEPGDDGAGAAGGLLESYADESLDELDRCEELLLRGEVEGLTAEGLETLAADLTSVVEVGEALGVAGLDTGAFAAAVAAAATAGDEASWVNGLLSGIDNVRYAIEVACETASPPASSASIPVLEFLKRLRRACRDRVREGGGHIRVEIDVDVMARVRLAAAENFYGPVVNFAGDAALLAWRTREEDETPLLRVRARVDENQLHVEIEDGAVDDTVGGETIQTLDARATIEGDAPLHPYRRGYVNVVQILVG